ncbi:MAG: hypothetical protein P8R42_26965 [Candidatus Binatia bacterium]|nr:hypothetical protein [Candidatus Binatia bacterium]
MPQTLEATHPREADDAATRAHGLERREPERFVGGDREKEMGRLHAGADL